MRQKVYCPWSILGYERLQSKIERADASIHS